MRFGPPGRQIPGNQAAGHADHSMIAWQPTGFAASVAFLRRRSDSPSHACESVLSHPEKDSGAQRAVPLNAMRDIQHPCERLAGKHLKLLWRPFLRSRNRRNARLQTSSGRISPDRAQSAQGWQGHPLESKEVDGQKKPGVCDGLGQC